MGEEEKAPKKGATKKSKPRGRVGRKAGAKGVKKKSVASPKYIWPETAVDAVIIDENQTIVLIKRRNPPFQNHWAIPGGFVELGEKVEDAVVREAKEETGLDTKIVKLVGVYSDPKRDPRGHVISITYLCKRSNQLETPSGGDDAKEAKVFNRKDLEKIQLAFDHKIIIQDAFKLADQEKLWMI